MHMLRGFGGGLIRTATSRDVFHLCLPYGHAQGALSRACANPAELVSGVHWGKVLPHAISKFCLHRVGLGENHTKLQETIQRSLIAIHITMCNSCRRNVNMNCETRNSAIIVIYTSELQTRMHHCVSIN